MKGKNFEGLKCSQNGDSTSKPTLVKREPIAFLKNQATLHLG